MSLVFGTSMPFFAFLLFDNITKSSLWCKSRLLWHFWYFPSFCCLYKLVQVQKGFLWCIGSESLPSTYDHHILARLSVKNRYQVRYTQDVGVWYDDLSGAWFLEPYYLVRLNRATNSVVNKIWIYFLTRWPGYLRLGVQIYLSSRCGKQKLR